MYLCIMMWLKLIISFPPLLILLPSSQVNGQNVRHSTHQQAVQWLVSQPGNIELLVEHVPQPPGLEVDYYWCTSFFLHSCTCTCQPFIVHVVVTYTRSISSHIAERKHVFPHSGEMVDCHVWIEMSRNDQAWIQLPGCRGQYAQSSLPVIHCLHISVLCLVDKCVVRTSTEVPAEDGVTLDAKRLPFSQFRSTHARTCRNSKCTCSCIFLHLSLCIKF